MSADNLGKYKCTLKQLVVSGDATEVEKEVIFNIAGSGTYIISTTYRLEWTMVSSTSWLTDATAAGNTDATA